jgi:hypothetical protein
MYSILSLSLTSENPATISLVALNVPVGPAAVFTPNAVACVPNAPTIP